MTKPANKCWCASCRKTYPDLPAVLGCPCGTPVPAMRGEYALTLEQGRLRTRTCSCGESLLMVMGARGGSVPLALSRAREVACQTCAPGRQCRACLGAGRHLLAPVHFLDCPNADRYHPKKKDPPR